MLHTDVYRPYLGHRQLVAIVFIRTAVSGIRILDDEEVDLGSPLNGGKLDE